MRFIFTILSCALPHSRRESRRSARKPRPRGFASTAGDGFASAGAPCNAGAFFRAWRLFKARCAQPEPRTAFPAMSNSRLEPLRLPRASGGLHWSSAPAREGVAVECAIAAGKAGSKRVVQCDSSKRLGNFPMMAATSRPIGKQNLDSDQPVPSVRMVTVPDDRDGQRIDNFLAGQLKGVPKSLIYRIVRTGQVRVNGKRAKADTRVAGGDQVRIPPVRVGEAANPGAPPQAQLEAIERAIIHEDRDFLVLDKPSGVASHGGSGVTFGAIELLRAARPSDTLELAHRLDRDTSGVPVFARKRSALTGLQELIRHK